jgi:hypothetical protein
MPTVQCGEYAEDGGNGKQRAIEMISTHRVFVGVCGHKAQSGYRILDDPGKPVHDLQEDRKTRMKE